MFKEFIGNKSTIEKIDAWFNDRHSNCIFIHGTFGNGKTFLVELFAEKYGYQLQRIEPYDITNKVNFNNMVKTLNLIPIESAQNKKLIIVENVGEFYRKYRKKLFEIQKVCRYPIIYTGLRKDIPYEYKNKVEVFEIKKPIPSYIKTFLESKLEEFGVTISDEILTKISKESISVRGALNSLYTSSPNDVTNPIPTYAEQLNKIKNGMLREDVDRKLLHYLFGNISDCKTMSDFCEYDMQLGRKFKTKLDKYLFNSADIDFVSNKYPEFMNQYVNDNDIKPYLHYIKDLHVSRRVFRRDFLKLVEIIEGNKKKEDDENVKKIKSNIKGKGILDFV